MNQFRALQTSEIRDGLYGSSVVTRSIDQLPEGELLIAVHYSSLNYKDALSASGHRGITRHYPHTPGVDAAGVVQASTHPDFTPGMPVVVTGYDLGMNTAGGFAEYIRVPAAWAIPLPTELSPREAMILGTAGLTAAIAVDKLQRMGLLPEQGEVLVTGATGGVGSLAVALLARLGYEVVASSGKIEQADYLSKLGAKRVIDRDTLAERSPRALLKPLWQWAIDTVGGDTLEQILKSLNYGGSVACCGQLSSTSLSSSIMPFILRGVNLLGVDSVELAPAIKAAFWRRLASSWDSLPLDLIAREITLEELPTQIERMLAGKSVGRVLVRVGA